MDMSYKSVSKLIQPGFVSLISSEDELRYWKSGKTYFARIELI